MLSVLLITDAEIKYTIIPAGTLIQRGMIIKIATGAALSSLFRHLDGGPVPNVGERRWLTNIPK